jgi:eukaryotic-like serine/threonine-protein kinase
MRASSLILLAMVAMASTARAEILHPRTFWSFQTEGPIRGSAVIGGDSLYFGSADGFAYAINKSDGRLRWRFQTGGAIAGAPAISGDTVIVVGRADHVYALNVATGQPRWSFKMQPLLPTLSATDGKLLWKYATAGVGYDLSKGFIRSDIFTKPSLQDGLLVVGSRDANVYAIDIAKREKKWSFAYDSTWAMSSIVESGTVFVGWSTNNRVNALDLATGAKKWEFDAGAHTYTTALIDGANVYWGSANGKLYKLDKATGALRWEYATGSSIYSSAISERDVLYFGDDDGRMHAVGEGGAPVARAIYLPASVPQNIAGFVIDPKLAPFLVEHGYERLDSAAALASWLAARRAGDQPSVVVFGFAQIPAALVGADPSTGPLRGYLDAGGRVVWPWGIPNKVTFDEQGGFVAYDPKVAAKLLDIEFVDFEDSGNYYSRATQDGRNWGLPAWLRTTFASVKSAQGLVPLAVDEYGRVGAFLKSFHSRPGSGWVTFNPKGFNVPITAEELVMLERVASYGLK